MHAHSRRGFLSTTLGAVWASGTILEQASLRAAQARAQSRTAIPTLFNIERVADGVYIALARAQVLINCNAVIFENAKDVLIVDTHSKPSAAAALVAQVRKQITPKPVRYVVNTHFHLDHTQGAAAYQHLQPQPQFVSCSATRRLLAESGASRAKESVEAARKSLDESKTKLGAAKAAAERAYYQDVAAQTAAYIEELQRYEPELPAVTFDRELILHDSMHELRLMFMGRGHTAGDIVVLCPQKNVVATGDLLHGFLPTILDGYPKEWPATLRSLSKLEFEHVLPGHGEVQRTHQRAHQMAAYIDEVTERVVRGKQAGRTAVDLQRDIMPSTLACLKRDGYGEFVGNMLLKYSANPPGTTVAEVVGESVRGNVAHIFQRLDAA